MTPTDPLTRVLELEAEARRLHAAGRILASHVVQMRADERRRTIGELQGAAVRR